MRALVSSLVLGSPGLASSWEACMRKAASGVMYTEYSQIPIRRMTPGSAVHAILSRMSHVQQPCVTSNLRLTNPGWRLERPLTRTVNASSSRSS